MEGEPQGQPGGWGSIGSVRQELSPGHTSSTGSVFLRHEVPEEDEFPAHLDSRLPLAFLLVPANAPIPRRTVDERGGVMLIPSLGDNSEVRATVVKTVTVDVIAFEAIAGG